MLEYLEISREPSVSLFFGTSYLDNNTNKTSEQFPFIWSQDLGLPLTRDFWDYLFRMNDNWGLTVYEQDHLSNTGHDLDILHNNVTFGRTWLLDMANAAAEADLSIQYCMVYPRFFMTSVELVSVTQSRASHDYTPGNTQWQMYVSAYVCACCYPLSM